jgi:hypothetical protein
MLVKDNKKVKVVLRTNSIINKRVIFGEVWSLIDTI